MPKTEEYCEIVAGGQKYRYWDDVEVTRNFKEVVSEIRLSVAEISPQGARSWSSLRLKPGDPVSAYLAGTLVATGKVAVRQVAYDKNTHAVRFIVQSKVADLVNGTVEAKPGQYRKSNLKQIAGAVLGPYGIALAISGAPAGADKIFERVSVQVGESPFELIERLCRMRNLHLVDDAQGNLIASRGGDAVGGDLQEGRNILSAQMVWREDQAVDQIKALGDEHGRDQKWGDEVRGNSATAKNPEYSGHRPLHILAEQPGDKQDMQMRADHEVDGNVGGMLTADITVRGWLRDDGSLWIEHVGKNVDVFSPMLFPMDKLTLAIQGVTHKQNDKQGTTTTISLVLPRALGSANKIETGGGPTGADPAKPDEADT
jgi:prophage tail gpP-like protein